MKLTLDEIRTRKVVPFPLEIQNYLLQLLGSGAYSLYSVADLIEAKDFISFCMPPDYVACVTTLGDIATMAITTYKLKDCRKADTLINSVFPLANNKVLHIDLVGNVLVAVEIHYEQNMRVDTTSMLDKNQAIELARRCIGGAL